MKYSGDYHYQQHIWSLWIVYIKICALWSSVMCCTNIIEEFDVIGTEVERLFFCVDRSSKSCMLLL
jgi:hypothetical protein